MIDDSDQVIEALVSREHRSFPHLALLAFAVTHEGEHRRLRTVELQAERHAGSDREALAERARRCLNARKLPAIGMALKAAVQLAQRGELFFREVASLGKRGVKRRCRMALRKKETVTVFGLRIFRIVLEHAPEIQRTHNVCRRK